MIPASARRRHAYQGGYAARLQGRSRYACPYEESRGWQAALAISWWEGWHEANEQLGDRDALSWFFSTERRARTVVITNLTTDPVPA